MLCDGGFKSSRPGETLRAAAADGSLGLEIFPESLYSLTEKTETKQEESCSKYGEGLVEAAAAFRYRGLQKNLDSSMASSIRQFQDLRAGVVYRIYIHSH